MSPSLQPDLTAHAVDRSRIRSGWPLLLAAAVWLVGLPLLRQLAPSQITATSGAALVGFAVLAALAAGVALLRMPSDPVTAPFVGLAAAVGTLFALAALDVPAGAGGLLSFLLVAPWRYALTPLVVHFALEIGWPHRRPQWSGWILGWYAVAAGMVAVVAIGLLIDEGALVDTVDHTFRASFLEPAGAAAAVVAVLLALATPVRGRALRRALAWTLAAIVIGMVPLILAGYLPALGQSIDGAVTPSRLALFALPALGLVAVLSVPFRDAAARDLLGYRLAAALLEPATYADGLRQIAVTLHDIFDTSGVALRVAEPESVVTVGEVASPAMRGPVGPAIDSGEEYQDLIVPIGRAGSPLGEVRLAGRSAGAFGSAEREWVTALLLPVAVVLRARRREAAGEERNEALAGRLAGTISTLTAAAHELPLPSPDNGVAVPPPVDAREVLAQMSDGVTGIARHGEGLAKSANDARDHARGASDSVARGLDALTALSAEVARLSRFGEGIAASNDTVSGVAFRTNLVANNAALEATRAGVAGRTFGVLAEEVRRLADTTAATSAAIGEQTAALAAEVGKVGATVEGTRHVLAAAIREAEAGEAAAQRLNDAAVELEDSARSLRPVLAEANAVASRRTVRDQHLTTTLERFLDERATLARALAQHRDAMDRLATTLAQLGRPS